MRAPLAGIGVIEPGGGPAIAYAVTPYGLTGAARAWPADDLTLQAHGGISIGIGLAGSAAAELDRRLGQETRQHAADALAALLAAAGVPAAPLRDASELAADTHFATRRLFEMVEHPVLGALPVYRLPWPIDGAPVPITRRAPLLGEHNGYALKEVLGYADERVAALHAAGVFA